MNNKPTQKELELEIMELEDELAYKKEQLERLYRINTNGRYFFRRGWGCSRTNTTRQHFSVGKSN